MKYKETYVTYKQAQSLKRLGFDWECECYYAIGKHGFCIFRAEGGHLANFNKDIDAFPIECSAPALHVAAKWLREVKGIAINVIAHDNEWLRGKYSYHEIYMPNCRVKGKQWQEWTIVKHYGAHDTYEAAMNEGITQMLKLLEGKI